MATLGGWGTIGAEFDPATGYGAVRSPQMLLAQKLMELKQPETNASQGSFWANLLNQGLRGGMAGYLEQDAVKSAEREREQQKKDAAAFLGAPGSAAPSAPPEAPSEGFDAPAAMPEPLGASAGTAPSGPGAIPEAQRGGIVNQAVAGTMVPPHVLAALIQQESGWNPRAVGKAGDGGLGQIIPSTAAAPGYGVAPISTADIADPTKNAGFAARYLEGRGRAAGLASPEDWQDPAKLARALKAYNGGGDPNYVANVTRFLPRGGTQVASSNPGFAPETGAPAPPSPEVAGDVAALQRGIEQARGASPAPGPSPFDAAGPQMPDAGGTQLAAGPQRGVGPGPQQGVGPGPQPTRSDAGPQVPLPEGPSPFGGPGVDLQPQPTRGQAMAAPLAGQGGSSTAPTGRQLAGRLTSPEDIDRLYAKAQQAATSTNPLIRQLAPGLQAQAQRAEAQLNAHTNRQDTLAAQRQTHADTLANQALQRDEARTRIGIEQERLDLDRRQKPLDAQDLKLLEHGKRFVAGSNRTAIEDIPGYSNGRADFGNSEDAKALNTYRDLYPVMARGQPNDQQRADYEAARNRLLTPKTQMSQSGQTIETPGRLPDLGKVYGPVPGETAVPTEQKLPQGAYRTGSGSIVYPGPQQPVPEKVVSEMLINVNGLRQVQTAAESLRKNPDAIGPIAGAFPQVRAWFDASGVPTQAAIAAIKSVQVHNVSGAAVTAAEEPRLMPWIPGLTDPKDVALAKLERFAAEYGNILRDKYEVYGPDSNHQANPVVERALLASPVEYTDDKAYERMKSGQVYRAPDGKLRTKQ